MRFRIPPHLKETVTVIRFSAYERDGEETIATDVKCMVTPGRALVRLESGVPIKQSDLRSDLAVLLEKPNSDIAEGDVLRRSDGSELQVYDVRSLRGGGVMLLETNSISVL